MVRSPQWNLSRRFFAFTAWNFKNVNVVSIDKKTEVRHYMELQLKLNLFQTIFKIAREAEGVIKPCKTNMIMTVKNGRCIRKVLVVSHKGHQMLRVGRFLSTAYGRHFDVCRHVDSKTSATTATMHPTLNSAADN